MSLDTIANQTLERIDAVLADAELTQDQRDQLARLVHASMRKVADQCCEAHREVTVQCCGPEADLAHKIAQEARQKTDLLVSNLMSLR